MLVVPYARYNKQVLKVFPFPITCTCLQFFVGAVLAGLSCVTGLLKPPKINKQTVREGRPWLMKTHCPRPAAQLLLCL